MTSKSVFFLIAFLLAPAAAMAGLHTYTGHGSVSISSAISVRESSAMRFGNFAVTSPGGGDASIVLGIDGARTRFNGASTQITLLNGGNSDTGAQDPGVFRITGAGAGATLYVSFTDHTGTPISGGNPVSLTGPAGSGEFLVDSFTFNLDGTDGTGDYILANGAGEAQVRVGATLHTKAGAASYAPGAYRGTYQMLISY